MKLVTIWIKIRQYFPHIIWHLGLWAGLIFVPEFWFGNLEYNHFFFNTYAYICIAVLPLYYFSFFRYMAIYHKPVRERFLQKMPAKSIGNHLGFLAKQLHFWLGYAEVALLFCISPLTTTSPTIAYLFGVYGNVPKTIPILIVYLAVLFALYVLGNLSAIKLWRDDEKQGYAEKKNKSGTLIILIATYAAAPMGFLIIWDFVTRYIPLIYTLAQMYASPLLIVLILFIILLAVFANFFRVFFTRKKCIKAIKKACKENGFVMTEIRHPYLSAFRVCKGESFQITTGKKTYSCKLLGAPKRGLPLAIHPTGAMHFLHSFSLFKATLYSYTTVRDFNYESDLTKILIINPVPKKLSCYFMNKIAEIDNGALVGEYKIYTATAFIRALETDTVERLR